MTQKPALDLQTPLLTPKKKHLPDLAQIEAALLKRHKTAHSRLAKVSAQAKKFLKKKGIQSSQLRQRSTQLLAGAGLTGALLLTPPGATQSAAPTHTIVARQDFHSVFTQNLSPLTPHFPTKLTPEAAAPLEQVILDQTGIPAKAVLEGQQLNHQVGYVGYEQHLQRFPGDNISLHDEEQIAGIAPGKGAWGYFASSKDEFTTEDYLREKYYSVAQTLYLENWNRDFRFLRDWYKYRKILIVNPKNGQAVVTVLADAGPAKWTGKQFGASPEAMQVLDLHKGPRKGLVLFLFIDDPENKIPLGPVTQKINL